jgi:PIN domain nuclease of toxin-antitoxin system
LLLNIAHRRSVCTISTLEIARLIWGGEINLKIPAEEWIQRTIVDLRAQTIIVSHKIALEAYNLPEPFHRDPADRQLVACARLDNLTLATADERILGYKHVLSVDARK